MDTDLQFIKNVLILIFLYLNKKKKDCKEIFQNEAVAIKSGITNNCYGQTFQSNSNV